MQGMVIETCEFEFVFTGWLTGAFDLGTAEQI